MPDDRHGEDTAAGAWETGLPDVALITRLANDVYTGRDDRGPATPSSSPTVAVPTAPAAYPTMPTHAMPTHAMSAPHLPAADRLPATPPPPPRTSIPGGAPARTDTILSGGARGLPFDTARLQDLFGPPERLVPPPPHAAAAPRLYFLRDEAPPAAPAPVPSFDVQAVRRDFPALHQRVHGRPLVWLDNAATSQKPRCVIDAVSRFYERDNSNVHRTAHALAARATEAYEGARRTVQRFLGARAPEEVVFVRGTTEGINLVAQTLGRMDVAEGDEIVVTELEHHANIVPWQMLAQEKGAVLRVVPIDDTGEVMLDAYARLLGPRTRLVALSHASNVLGTILPVEIMTRMAHCYGARVLIDGAQSVPHFRVDVQAIDCDFYVFSGHKLFAPTGVGVLYGKADLLRSMPPWQGGGNMIDSVGFEGTTYADIPHKFEAGTGILAGAIGLGAAIDYLDRLGFDALTRYEHALLAYASRALATLDGVRIFGNAPHKVGVLSFVVDGARPEDVSAHLDRQGIAVRAGHHCAQPTMRRYGVTGTVRASLAFYNDRADVDALVTALRRVSRHARP